MPTILDRILATKHREIEAARVLRPEAELRRAVADAPPVRDFAARLTVSRRVSLIAEIKKASPSRGVIRDPFYPVEIARAYEQGGASCLSVLTDQQYFQGSLDYLRRARDTVQLPVLRKDFIIDSYQLLEARVAGADAVLLIAECLDDCNLRKLNQEALELGMAPLVEFYEEDNLARVLAAGCTLIGINNRDLRTFQTDLQHTLRLRALVPQECILVSESGIRSHDDVQRLAAAGVDAMLVGECLMGEQDIPAAVSALLGEDRPC